MGRKSRREEAQWMRNKFGVCARRESPVASWARQRLNRHGWSGARSAFATLDKSRGLRSSTAAVAVREQKTAAESGRTRRFLQPRLNVFARFNGVPEQCPDRDIALILNLYLPPTLCHILQRGLFLSRNRGSGRRRQFESPDGLKT